jgi:predicted DCC family thiol-disulfide oxidoreductase YuxK
MFLCKPKAMVFCTTTMLLESCTLSLIIPRWSRISSSLQRDFVVVTRRPSFLATTTRNFFTASPTTANPNNNNNNKPKQQPRQKKLLFEEELNILYDSKCNVCRTEVEFLIRRDQRRNHLRRRLRCTDIESGYYDPDDPVNGGISYAQAMSSMHAVTQYGEIVSGVAVFQRAYAIVGLGWLMTVTKYSGMRWIADCLYNLFAKYRTKITRGATLQELISIYEERQKMVQSQCDTTSLPIRRNRRRRGNSTKS